MSTPKPNEDEEPYYVYVAMQAAYDVAAECRFDDAIAGLRHLQRDVDPRKAGTLANPLDYTLVTEAIADILCLAGRQDDARRELTLFLKAHPYSPGAQNILAKTSFHRAISTVDEPARQATDFNRCANDLLTAEDIYTNGYFTADEQTLRELQHETHIVAAALLKEVYARHNQIKHLVRGHASYTSLLVSAAEIAGKLKEYGFAKTFLDRHGEIAPLDVRGLVTNAEIQARFGQFEDARKTLKLIEVNGELSTTRTIERIHQLGRNLRALAAGT